MGGNDSWLKIADPPAARRFEERYLGSANTVGDTRLSPPLLFREDDVPTYIIQVGES